MKILVKTPLALVVILGINLFGCAEKRPEEFVQGQGQDLLAISEYQGKEFTVTTGDALSNSQVTLSQALIDNDIPAGLDNMQLVQYQSSSPLFNDVPLRGRAHKQYRFNYELNDQFLIINKIAPKEHIPFQELTYAKKIGDNLYSVPLVGYPIVLVRIDNIKTPVGENSNQLSEFGATRLEEASHFKVDLFKRIVFDAIKKNDVFPEDIFAGEWFYAATIVSAETENAVMIGRDMSTDFKAQSVSRIKFIKTPKSVRAVNTNIDSNIDKSETINLQTAIEIPVAWVDYRVQKNGRNFELKEEKLNDENKDSKHWSERKFLEVDFAHTKSSIIESNAPILENLEISKGYISFTVHYTADQIKIKYALKKAHTPKAGRIYKKDDQKVYGLFTTEKHFIDNHRFHRKEDYERLVLMNRFYPDNNEIRYYFSSNTPENMKESGRIAIKAWNKTFTDAQTNIKVVLDETKTVSLGDVRYNIINIIDTKDGSGLLGYGPSIVDSESGEIISATTNIYANPFREGLIESIRTYIKYRLGMFKNQNISTIKIDKMKVDKVLENGLEAFSKSNLTNKDSANKSQNLLKLVIEKNREQSKARFGNTCNYQTQQKDLIERIEAECKSDLDSYIDELKESSSTHNEKELPVLETCAEKLISDDLVSTLVHELGHNFGLRHNFTASNDAKNFSKNLLGKVIARTSSIMDYQNGMVHELAAPGGYDEETIRFAYANTITLKDDSLLKIDTKKSLKEQLSAKKLEKREFKYCTDEDVGQTDPMCQRHDDGVNPYEVVKNIIEGFQASYEINGHRYDRAYSPNTGRFTSAHLQRTLLPLKLIHDQWRYHLAQFVAKDNRYLENFSIETFPKILEAMKNDKGVHGKNYREYYEASDLAYKFLKNLAMTSAKYCLVKNINDNVSQSLIDFDTLRTDVFKQSGVSTKDCTDPEVVSFMAANNLTVLKAVGSNFNPLKKSLDILDPEFEQDEIVGLANLRMIALQVLFARIPTYKQHAIEEFTPNFLDNPNYAMDLINVLTERVYYGVTANNSGVSELGKKTLPLFNTEKFFIANAYVEMVQALGIPEKVEASNNRTTPFNVLVTTNPNKDSFTDETIVTTQLNTYIITNPAAPLTHKFNEKRRELINLKNLAAQNIQVPNTAQVNDLLKNFKSITAAELGAIKFVDYIAKVKELVEMILAVEDAMAKKYLITFFQPEYSLFKFTTEQMTDEDKATLNDKSALEALPMVFGSPDVLGVLPMEGRAERVQKFIKTLEQQKVQGDFFLKNKKELEAQLDLFTLILMSI